MGKSTAKRVRKSKTTPASESGIRFNFDFHGLRSTFVPVQEEQTDDASNSIAAAIHRAWIAGREDDT